MSANRLLLIEDHYDVAEMLMMYFSSHQYEVLHADTGEEGIIMARTHFPNLILLDVMLPDMDGYDTCLQLRKMALTKYIPIIFLTQRDERAHKVKGLQLGADDYVTKPFDIDELRLRVQGSIRRATRENLHEPRTGLPTGPLIHEELSDAYNKGAVPLRITIETFKVYNDVYGFLAAADVLNHAAKTIQAALAESGTPNDFIGIENDDFVVLTYSSSPDALAELIRERFQNAVKTFYTFTDAERGGVLQNPGTDEEVFIPFMKLSIDRNLSHV